MLNKIKTAEIVWQSLYGIVPDNVRWELYDKLHTELEREINILVWPAVHIFLRGDVE